MYSSYNRNEFLSRNFPHTKTLTISRYLSNKFRIKRSVNLLMVSQFNVNKKKLKQTNPRLNRLKYWMLIRIVAQKI